MVLNLPEVCAVSMVGYHRSEEDSNKVAALFVILKQEVSTSQKDVYLKIRETLSAELTEDQNLLIHDIYFTESFPLSTCGKIDRRALRKLALEKKSS